MTTNFTIPTLLTAGTDVTVPSHRVQILNLCSHQDSHRRHDDYYNESQAFRIFSCVQRSVESTRYSPADNTIGTVQIYRRFALISAQSILITELQFP